MKKTYGYIPSPITSSTVKFQAPKSMPIPSRFSYRMFLSPVTNQGSDPYCIPHSVACWLNWKVNTKKGVTVDNHIRYADIYNRGKKSAGDGMTYQEAFKYLKTFGVKTDRGVMKISEAGYIPSIELLKPAILANGPCFGALPVYDSTSKTFWKKTRTSPEGWHSITIVGWNEKGYVIRNSWGTSFSDRGYAILPYEDANSFKEIWTILG